jgi:hypothetical protein
MAQLAIRLQKYLQVGDRPIETDMGAVATLRRLTDETGARAGAAESINVVVPANDRGPARNVTVSPGRWLIEATLPSGEIIAEQVDVESGSDRVAVTLHGGDRSPQEWLGWQHLLGNVESVAVRNAVQERARRSTKVWMRLALGERVDPRLIDRIADSVADAASSVWDAVVRFAGLLRRMADWVSSILAGRGAIIASRELPQPDETAPPSTTSDAEAAEMAAAPVVQLVTFDADAAGAADPWTAVLAGDAPGVPQSPTKVVPLTWIYELKRDVPVPIPGELEPIELLPRHYLQVTSDAQVHVIALPLPWPASSGGFTSPVQVMLRRPSSEGDLQIGVAVADPTFGALSGFMTATTLSKATVAVDEDYAMLFGKLANPLAAAAGGYILVAAGDPKTQDWPAWLDNLEAWFPALPDAAVLRGSLLLRTARDQADLDKAREAFLHAFERGIPYFSLGVSWLLDGLTVFSDHPGVRSRGEKVQQVAKRLDLSQAFTVIRVSRSAATDAQGAPITQASSATGGPDTMAEYETSATPTTFTAPDLAPEATAKLSLADFVTRILAELSRLKDEREAYYDLRRSENSMWANGSRQWLAIIGAVALLLTGLAAALRFAPESWKLDGYDRVAFIAVLAMYALMGALSFYEKGTDRTSAYFRHLLIILAIRDLWTKLQFEVLKELSALQAAPEPNAEIATRQRIHALAEAFCNDLNKATTIELSEWRTEFVTSLSELAQAAQKGSEDVTKQIQDVVKAADKAAADAKASAEKAEASAKAAETAAQPGYLNVTLGWDFDGEAVVLVDGLEAARSTGKVLTIGPIAPGFKKLVARAQKGDKKLEASKTVKVEPGLRDMPFPG